MCSCLQVEKFVQKQKRITLRIKQSESLLDVKAVLDKSPKDQINKIHMCAVLTQLAQLERAGKLAADERPQLEEFIKHIVGLVRLKEVHTLADCVYSLATLQMPTAAAPAAAACAPFCSLRG